MTKEELAQKLNGREYGEEITGEEEKAADESRLVVLFGASDDLAEFRGAFNDELGCCDGGYLYVDIKGILLDHDCDCDFCGYKDRQAKARKIEAIWDKDGYSWQYKTDIPHATFEIIKDSGERKYCRGIVFNVSDLK